MATSYPDRTNARGIWTVDDITKNIKTQGTWPNAAAKALVGGGDGIDVIDQFIISTTGNATDFGDLTAARYQLASCGSNTRGIWAGGYISATSDVIDYVSFATVANAADFGNLSAARNATAGMSNTIRGIFAAGDNPKQNTIDYITMATTGNATDFGDRTVSGAKNGAASNSIRGIMAGGHTPSNSNVIDYIQLNTTGNAVDFGDCTAVAPYNQMFASTTRAMINSVGTGNPSTITNVVTIASTGDAVIFQELASGISTGTAAATSGNTRGIVAGGDNDSGNIDVIQYVNIVAAGTFTDFGDLSAAMEDVAGCSNGHGGLDVFDPDTR